MRPNGHHTQPFTPEMWHKWLKRLNGEAEIPRLRDGIEQMRILLERREQRRR